MKKTTEPNVEIGTSAAPEMFYIKILADGPYLVCGNPPIDQEIIMPNEDGASWVYKKDVITRPKVNIRHFVVVVNLVKNLFAMVLILKRTGIRKKQATNVLYWKMPNCSKVRQWYWPIMRNIVLLLVFVMHTVVSGILYRLRKLKMK